MKNPINFIQLSLLLLFSINVHASDAFDDQRPADIGDKQWSSLKAAVQETKLLPTPEGIGGEESNYGYAVSVDGTRALIGAPEMAVTGLAFILEFDGSDWQEVATLQASDGAVGDQFGFSVSLSGDRALVGAYLNDNNGDDSGSAYVFKLESGNTWVEESKLVPSDGAEDDRFGSSVSLSGDRALVGAYRDDDNGNDSGSAYVFKFDGVSTWMEEDKLVPIDGDEGDTFGRSVSLSGDRALMGASEDDDNGSKSGSAYVFKFDGVSAWGEEDKLVASDGAADDFFGNSVSLSGDRALVGAYRDSDNGNDSGSAYVYKYDGVSAWMEEDKLVPIDGAEDDEFGFSVSLSGDRALVGAYIDDDNGDFSGSAYVFKFDGMSTWMEEDKLVPIDGATNDRFGYSVSLSGNRAMVGAYLDNDNGNDSGSVYMFEFDGMGAWVEEAKLTASDGAALDTFGYSVSLSGNRALVGAYQDDDNGNNSGSAYVFKYEGGRTWVEEAKLVPIDGAEEDQFGRSVSLSGDRALVGAYQDDDNGNDSGSVYVFKYDGVSAWEEEAKLTASDGTAGDFFGDSVSLSGNRALVGAFGDDDNGSSSGSAYVFRYDGMSAWEEEAKLTASDGAANHQFGGSVSLSGDRALVGAIGNNGFTGSAYVFKLDDLNASWSEEAKLIASDGDAFDQFGRSVSLSDDRALVGAWLDDDDGSGSGSAYVFKFDGVNTWGEEAKLTASDGAGNDNFGYSVSLSGERALVGAYRDDDNGDDAGSAYVFEFDGVGTWGEEDKLIASDGAVSDQFGFSVSLSGNLALVGAIKDDDRGTDSGSTYVINLNDQYFIGGAVSGLLRGNNVVLQNNLSDDITVTSNTEFIFPTPLNDLESYSVTVASNPESPIQTCQVKNGSSFLDGDDVIDVSVSCEWEQSADLIYRHGFEDESPNL